MAVPASFQPMTSSILPSQEREVLIAKQSALHAHGQETRNALNRLPPSAVDSLMGEYRPHAPQALDEVAAAIAGRERIFESAQKGQNLDADWLQQGAATQRGVQEADWGADDPWNGAPAA